VLAASQLQGTVCSYRDKYYYYYYYYYYYHHHHHHHHHAEGIRGLLGEKGLIEEDWNDRDKWKKKIR
jgi:hypothetical protein